MRVTTPPQDFDVPTFCGAEKRRELYRRWGPPNIAPRMGESPFGKSRVLFVDDDRDGAPVAYWVPDDCEGTPGLGALRGGGSYFGIEEQLHILDEEPRVEHAEESTHEPADGDDIVHSGRRLDWRRTSSYTVLVPLDKVTFMEGNTWDGGHAAGLRELAQEGRVFDPPAARLYRITEADVEQTQRWDDEGELEYQMGMVRPWEPEDAGSFYVQLLDGNHRALVALALDEEYIPVNVGDNYREDVRNDEWVTAEGGGLGQLPADADDDLVELYHVTYESNLESIGQEGLDPQASGVFSATGYAAHSQGRVFLTAEDGINFWYGTFEQHAEHHAEDILEEQMVPVVLRVRTQLSQLAPDEPGTRDSMADAYFTAERIEPEDLELWDGKAWVEPSEGVDPELALQWMEDDDFEEGGFWQFKPYDNPLEEPDVSLPWYDVDDGGDVDARVTVYHSTDKRSADRIVREQALRSRGEPDVYVSSVPTTAYGPAIVAMEVPESVLLLDDEFPDGRQDFRIRVGRPGTPYPVQAARRA